MLSSGATGGLGGGVVRHISKHAQKSNYAPSSSRLEAAEQFESSGILFRHANSQDRASLDKTIVGVKEPLFVSG